MFLCTCLKIKFFEQVRFYRNPFFSNRFLVCSLSKAKQSKIKEAPSVPGRFIKKLRRALGTKLFSKNRVFGVDL